MLGFTYEELYFLNQKFKSKKFEQRELLNNLKSLKTDENLIKMFINNLIEKIEELSSEEYKKLVNGIPFDTPF